MNRLEYNTIPNAQAIRHALQCPNAQCECRRPHSSLAHCPTPMHGRRRGDRHPSLSVREGRMRVLLRCFAGCSFADIVEVLRRRGLWPERRRGPR
jgi:hypothetical protein